MPILVVEINQEFNGYCFAFLMTRVEALLHAQDPWEADTLKIDVKLDAPLTRVESDALYHALSQLQQEGSGWKYINRFDGGGRMLEGRRQLALYFTALEFKDLVMS